MAAPLKLIQLNIERGLHLPDTIPFLRKEAPDIVCLQEVYAEHVPELEAAVGGSAVFEPMSIYDGREHGVAIVTKHKIVNRVVYQIGEYSEPLPVYDESTFESKYTTSRFVALQVDVMAVDTLYRVVTTHLPVTDKGEPAAFQDETIQKLLAALEAQGDLMLTGDFNAPRGGRAFSKLASVYTDNVPSHYKTSIDIARHRSGKVRPHELVDKMVDGVFSTPGYMVTDVRLQDGVSDHCAVIASIEKR